MSLIYWCPGYLHCSQSVSVGLVNQGQGAHYARVAYPAVYHTLQHTKHCSIPHTAVHHILQYTTHCSTPHTAVVQGMGRVTIVQYKDQNFGKI